MNLLSFIQQFPGETDCLEYFRLAREKVGITCTRCGNKQHQWLPGKSYFECICCRNHTSINSGTILENTVLPIKYWFITIQLLTSTEVSISSSEIQNLLGVKQPEPVYDMCNKLKLLIENGATNFDSLLMACATNHPEIGTQAN
ncbi:MAG: transposase [Paludibacter sp.]